MTNDEAFEAARQAYEAADIRYPHDQPVNDARDWALWLMAWDARGEADARVCEAQQVKKSQEYFPWAVFDGACEQCATAIRGMKCPT
jgi:hypothetical protein